MTMSRRTYRAVAAELQAMPKIRKGDPDVYEFDLVHFENVVAAMASLFADDNTSFDRTRFFVACGIDESRIPVL